MSGMSSPDRAPVMSRPLALLLVLVGLGGLLGSFELVVEYIRTLKDPAYTPSCSVNLVVTCTPNMQSWQGSMLGFPNALLGLIAFAVPVVVGMSVLAGARLARWYWALFDLGLLGGYVFITWLYSQSIFSLGTLCPWCMEVWFFTIIGFWYTTAWLLRAGVLGRLLEPVGRWLMQWAWVVIVLNLLLIAVLAQIRLDWLSLL
jgi:uncharacterized membrane protein